jgi:hypothetical protein
VVTLVDPITARNKQQTFFKLLFGRAEGYVCLAFLSAGTRKMQEEFFQWPDELPQMLEAVGRRTQGNNVYFCSHLFDGRTRKKENVVSTPNAWADLDSCDPDNMLVAPSVTVETSPGRWHAYWVFERDVDPDDAEALSRRIAYAHEEQGADRSGWDLTQLLRVPYTYNYKYAVDGMSIPLVEARSTTKKVYRLSDFDDYPEHDGYVSVDIPVPTGEVLPDKSAEDLLQERRGALNPLVWRHFIDEPITDWSKTLWNFQMLLFEAGFSREEVFVIVREAKCNKYARDARPTELLWKEVCRAAIRAEENYKLLTGIGDVEALNLITPEEIEEVQSAPDTFVERYQRWAKGLGDAAQQYHQAGAFIALSSLLAGAVKLPTSFGVVVPNLWFMILADTTLTRKSTAMDLAMELVMEVDDDVLLATDGSLEGMITSLASRPGRPSVFLRDEFSGLLEAMTKKDYMAGFAENLTKLYDCKPMKRLLRKEVVEVRNPILVLFAGGIREKICSLLTFEHVSSGFMPRFVFITAESDPAKVQPLGPPTEKIDNGKAAIRRELEELTGHYHQTYQMEVPKVVGATITAQKEFPAVLTPEAWQRYNQFEKVLIEDGLLHERSEIMTPVNARLGVSVLKAAVLMSASRQRGNEVVVEREDILRAIYYGKEWKAYANIVMSNVGRGTLERQIDSVLRILQQKPGSTRSVLMQSMHLTAQQASALFETMDQRGLIVRQRAGRTERLFPVAGGKK